MSIDGHPELCSKTIKPLIHKGEDLMKLFAGSDVQHFARSLADKLIEKKDLEFKMLSPRKLSKKVDFRTALDDDVQENFRGNFCHYNACKFFDGCSKIIFSSISSSKSLKIFDRLGSCPILFMLRNFILCYWFSAVIEQKYPLTPLVAYEAARSSVNQMLRDSVRGKNDKNVSQGSTD